jgi:hypothetical protein
MSVLPHAPQSVLSLFLLLLCFAEATPDSGPPLPPSPASAQCLAWGDFDGDSAPDMVVLSHRYVDSLYVLLNQEGELRRPSGNLYRGLQAYAHTAIRAAVSYDNKEGRADLVLEVEGKQILFRNLGPDKSGKWLGLQEASSQTPVGGLAQKPR